MGDRVRRSGAGESGSEWWQSQRADLPEVHTSQRQHHSGKAVVARAWSSAARTVCGSSFTHTIEGGGWAMRKLIAVGVLVGGLLAGAGSAMAQLPGQGGAGDPLTLAASGVLIPFITGGTGEGSGSVALIEVASPVGPNSNAHMLFYNDTCARVGDSVGIPLTENDIAFQDITKVLPLGTSGLVAIAGVDPTGFTLVPLSNPIHSRVYLFSPTNGRSRVLEPIIIDPAEFGFASDGFTSGLWSPLRTAATFYAPLETTTIKTQLTLVCPLTTIQGDITTAAVPDDPNTPGIEGKPAVSAAAFGGGIATDEFSSTGFPMIVPPFRKTVGSSDMRARIYDTNEIFLRDVRFTCNCLTADLSVSSLSSVYADTSVASLGTYTELETTSTTVGSFTGYRAVFAVGSPLNNFSGRLSNGNRLSIQGGLTSAR